MVKKIDIIGTLDGIANCVQFQHINILDNADIIIGAKRHIELVKNHTDNKNLTIYPSPFSNTKNLIENNNYNNIVFLASGDPCWFGATNFISKNFSNDYEIISHPNIGTFSHMANKLCIQLQDCICTTIHGRDKHEFIKYLNDGVNLMILSENSGSYIHVCEILNKHGFENSQVHIFEHIGGEFEKYNYFKAHEYKKIKDNIADLNALYVKVCGKKINNKIGIDEAEFFHDGQITKSDIRAISVSRLNPTQNSTLLDLGSGSGSVSIEYMNMGGFATCVEKNENRCENILKNSLHFGHPSLKISNTSIENFLTKNNELYDSIFIGGGSSSKKNITDAFGFLKPGGVLVVNCVTIQSQQIIFEIYQEFGGFLEKFSSQKLKQIQNFEVWEKSHELVQFVYKKEK